MLWVFFGFIFVVVGVIFWVGCELDVIIVLIVVIVIGVWVLV